MATDRDLIVRTIAAFMPLPVTNAVALRKQAEWTIARRPLNWEEWQDIRDAWAKRYNAYVAVLPRDDDKALQRAEEQAVRNGCEYLLLEYI